MAKDPNYDRYAGMVSLPGADGKLPRPFRVDEDGNVIYWEQEAGAKVFGDLKSREIARAGILGWDELDRGAEEGSGSSVRPAMFVNLSDEAESTNWEMRDREGRVINRPRRPRTGSSDGRRGGGSGGGKGDGKSAPKVPPKPKNNNS